MTTTTLGNLSLGIVSEVMPVWESRLAGIPIPNMRGDSKQYIGENPSGISLVGELNGVDRYDSLAQMLRVKDLGMSLKLLSDSINTVVWLRSVVPAEFLPVNIIYELVLEESMFTQADPCDAVTEWSVDSGGGTLTAPTATPNPREGSAYLKLSGTIAAATSSRLKFTPADSIDLGDSKWLAFWFRTNMLTPLTSANIKFYHAAGHHCDYDFSALITAADVWERIMIPKASFAETGSMEWDEVLYVTIDMIRASQQTYYFLVDDLGGYE